MTYREGNNYLKPNVSISDDKGSVYYNYPPPPDFNGHKYVDLGLPSGTIWATMNVGASKASDSGLYFQWGDTQGYTADQVGKDKQFSDDDYKWRPNVSYTMYSKYITTGATLDLEDDAAHVNMGGSWHMPTPDQIKELTANTTSTWTTQYGVNGRLFTSKNGKSIFIPAGGWTSLGSIDGRRNRGYVWSSMLDTEDVRYVPCLDFGSGDVGLVYNNRIEGRSVRGVVG